MNVWGAEIHSPTKNYVTAGAKISIHHTNLGRLGVSVRMDYILLQHRKPNLQKLHWK